MGDDGYDGSAESYEVKVYDSEINDGNWSDIPAYQQNMIPQPSSSMASCSLVLFKYFISHLFLNYLKT